MPAQIIQFPSSRDTTEDPLASKKPLAPNVRVIGVNDVPEKRTNQPISTDELYSNIEGVSSELNTALRLLAVSTDRIQEAVTALQAKESITADDAMQRFQSMLPELFCLRGLGEGFAMIINALLCAFQNLEGTPLDERQLNAVNLLVRKVRTEPFLQPDSAVDAIASLEKAGLVIEPDEMDVLADLLDG